MIPKPTFQCLIIEEDLQRPKKYELKSKKKKYHVTCWEKTKRYLKLFLETSSIHGLAHLVAPRRYYMEIILWLQIIILSTAGSLYLSSLTWSRYQSSPTVVSLDRNMLAWNTTFPSVTICPVNAIDDGKLAIYLRNSKEENKTRLSNFIISIANASYKNFEHVPEYPDIPSDKYTELLINLSAPFKTKLTIDQISNVVFAIEHTITEMGLCYSVNSRTAIYNSPEYRAANRWDIISNEKDSLYIHPLDGEVFAKLSFEVSASYHIYIHGPQEIPEITSKSQILADGYYMKSYVTALTVYTSKEAAKLSVNQRRCRFPYENDLKHNSIYTYNMCRMECRIRLSLQYCQCIPHFYRRIGDEKICDVEGLHCLSKYKDELYTLQDKEGKRLTCACYPLCDDVNYVLEPIYDDDDTLYQYIGNIINIIFCNSIHRKTLFLLLRFSQAIQKWILGTNLQWGMVTYPRMRYRRDIIFGFTDLLVAVGSMAGLFLGCSVLSFMEIVYFLTLRLLCYSYGHRFSE